MEKKYISQLNDQITIQEIISILRKRLTVLLSIVIAITFSTFLYLKFFVTPLYEATAKIKIPTNSSGIGSFQNPVALILGAGTGESGENSDIVTQQEIILSRPVLEKVVKKTNLLEIKKKELKAKEELTLDKLIDMLKDEKLPFMKKIISVEDVKNSPIIEITVADKDRELALKVLKELINEYTEAYIKINKDEKASQLEILEKQIPELEKEISQLSEEIKQFKLRKSFSPSEEANAYFSKLITLTNDKSSLESEYEVTDKNIKNVRKEIEALKGSLQKRDYTPKSALLDSYMAKLSDLQVQYNTALVKYTENHPNVVILKKQIQEIQEQIDNEIKRIANSQVESTNPLLQNLYSQLLEEEMKLPILRVRIELINKAISQVEAKIQTLPGIEQEYIKLQRDYELKQNIYKALVQKYEELKLNTVSTETNRPQIIDPPYVPEKPSRPNKKLTFAISFVFGIFLGIIGSFFREATDKKIRTVSEIQKLCRVPIIINAKEDQKQAVQTMISHIFTNYPNHRKIAISSPDDQVSINKISQSISDLLSVSSVKYSLIETTKKDYLITAQNLESQIEEELRKNDYVVIKTSEFKNNYDPVIASKKSDGLILTIKLNYSEKIELLKTLSVLEQNNVEVYGIIVL